MQAIVVFITAPDQEAAAGIGRVLVEERLAACVNIVGGIRSIYTWEGAVQDDSEALMIVKTRRELFPALSDRVKALHGYSVPEIIAMPIIEGSPDYLSWIRDVTS